MATKAGWMLLHKMKCFRARAVTQAFSFQVNTTMDISRSRNKKAHRGCMLDIKRT